MTADPAALLRAYDEQLRGPIEMPGAPEVHQIGPASLGVFGGSRGFITARDFRDVPDVAALVGEALDRLRADPAVTEIEWKTRAHDDAPGLVEALLAHGFVPEDAESIMIGEASALAVDVPLPDGVVLRRVTEDADAVAMARMQAEVFGDTEEEAAVQLAGLRKRLAQGGVEAWIAEADGRVISAGRIDPVPGTEFAGIWGGATVPEWRHRGVYRALTAARARAAVAVGKRYINSDSTEYSRPILERSGFVKVSTTTPYVWRRAEARTNG